MTAWENGASPAAAAVSRALAAAGVHRSREVVRGVETEGFHTAPHGDHVRVEYVPGLFGSSDEPARGRTRVGLLRCKHALESKYDTALTTGQVAFPGEWLEWPVLEVRPRG